MDLNENQDSSTQQQLIDIMKLMLEEKKEEADLEDIIYFLKNTAERASRSSKQMKPIINYFNNMQFFAGVKKEYGQEVANKCYNELKYEFFPKGSTVFNFGEFGTKFYIVVKGKVSCKIPFLKEITTKDKNFKNWRDFLCEDDKRCATYDDLKNK